MQLEAPLQLPSSGAAPQLRQQHDGKRLVETSGETLGALTLPMALRTPFPGRTRGRQGLAGDPGPWSLGMPGSGLGRTG